MKLKLISLDQQTKNMSWGYRIVILYVAFVGGMLYLVYRCTQEDVELVSTDYYEQELKYQDKINQEQNSHNDHANLHINYQSEKQEIEIKFPEHLSNEKMKGDITMFRPDNSKLDYKIPVLVQNGKQIIPTEKLMRGLWRIKTSWTAGATPYFQEEKIFIQ